MYIGEQFMRECPLLQQKRSFQQELDEKGFDREWLDDYIENQMSTTERLCALFGLSLFGCNVEVNMGKLLLRLDDQATRDCIARFITQGYVD